MSTDQMKVGKIYMENFLVFLNEFSKGDRSMSLKFLIDFENSWTY